MYRKTKILGSILALVAVTLIILYSGCTSDKQTPQTTPAVDNQSTYVTPTVNETPTENQTQDNPPVMINASNTTINNSDMPNAAPPNVAASVTVTPIINGSVISGCKINIHLVNNGGPLAFTSSKAVLENGQGSGVAVINWHNDYIDKDGHEYYYTKLPSGATFDDTFNMNSDISKLQQSSRTGKLGLHVTLHMPAYNPMAPKGGTDENPTLQNTICTFDAVIPSPSEMSGAKEYPLTFTDATTVATTIGSNVEYKS